MENMKIAIILLSYADYEALEISLAAYTKHMKPNYKLFILQNGRGTYDCERTYRVALRYKVLCPDNIEVVDWIKPQEAYFAIKELYWFTFIFKFPLVPFFVCRKKFK